jgi:hypothetical protein
MTRTLTLLPVVLLAAALPATAVAAGPTATASSGLVIKGKLKKFNFPKATYTSSRGTYTATFLKRVNGHGHYKLSGTIKGRRFTGRFVATRVKGDRFTAKGTGKLGSKKVRISGGGPNSLKTTTLVLR